MTPFIYVRILLLLCLPLFAQAQVYGPGDWNIMGITHTVASPYDLVYYKIAEVKNNTDRYASIIDVSVQADANYVNQQGTYRIRIDKFEGTANRFDAMHINCISGNPGAATFYVFENALWVRSNYHWRSIFYKSEGMFTAASPLTLGNWNATIQPPAGYLKATAAHGLVCDFDNNRMYEQPYTGLDGALFIAARMGIGVPHAYNTLVLPNSGSIAWKHTNGENEIIGINSNASNDLTVYAGGPDRLYIKSATGNVGIGTTAPGDYKLAVEGTIGARKVRVTSVAWADFVFEDYYNLMPLAELEQFISINKRLPGVPSGKDVEKSGIELGEMNSTLLQKIEELTLYLIDHRKELDALKTDNKVLRNELEQLKKYRDRPIN